VEKRSPKIMSTFVLKNCPKKTIAQWAKIRPNSPNLVTLGSGSTYIALGLLGFKKGSKALKIQALLMDLKFNNNVEHT
jgi:hypothetical protein